MTINTTEQEIAEYREQIKLTLTLIDVLYMDRKGPTKMVSTMITNVHWTLDKYSKKETRLEELKLARDAAAVEFDHAHVAQENAFKASTEADYALDQANDARADAYGARADAEAAYKNEMELPL